MAACLLPLMLAIACVILARPVSVATHWGGVVLVTAACLVGILNFSLRFLRPHLYERRHGSMAGYRLVSGLPVVGTLLQVAGCSVAFGSTAVGLIAVVSCLIDVDGLVWFPALTWKDDSLWDAR